ncbi:MAG: NfeD family protein [Blautia sp.]|nr:NfeD family protein [Blautia sp.]
MQMVIWLAVMVFLLFTEATTINLVTIWFAGGALAAAIAAYLHAGVIPQMLIFLAVSLVLLLITRPLCIKFMKKNNVKTNVDSLIGRTAVVTEDIDNLAQTGKVLINDVDWMARTTSDTVHISKGAVVKIEEVRGAHLIVKESRDQTAV